jgi:hypothetical protein
MDTIESLQKEKDAILQRARELRANGELTDFLKLEMVLDMSIISDKQKALQDATK